MIEGVRQQPIFQIRLLYSNADESDDNIQQAEHLFHQLPDSNEYSTCSCFIL